MQQPPPQNVSPEKLDNISKVKALTAHLRELLLHSLMKTAAENIRVNNLIDTGSPKIVDIPQVRFDKALEEFYAVCDQIEYHLKTTMECYQQGLSSQRYLPFAVVPTRTEVMPNRIDGQNQDNSLTYPQYLNTVRSQISYLKEVHDVLMEASQNVNQPE